MIHERYANQAKTNVTRRIPTAIFTHHTLYIVDILRICSLCMSKIRIQKSLIYYRGD